MNDTTLFLPSIADGEDKSCPLKNCIRNNYRHIRKWAKRTETNAFRIYDRNIREYPLAIDFYDGRFCIHYFRNSLDSDEPCEELRREAEGALSSLFHATPDLMYWRTRIRRQKMEQYAKADASGEYFTVLEYGLRFKINLLDYLDTGLFLDHRETRKWVASLALGKRVLNLFAYTCSFSIHAAACGASFTKSVDMSNTYTEWGRDNFRLNNIAPTNHPIIRADCLKFLEEEKEKYDIIIIDPPTISRSKKMDQLFDIQQDHPYLIKKALSLLNPDGLIIFSTNSRKFTFDESLSTLCSITDISEKTIPLDFHNQKIHRCWGLCPQTPAKGQKPSGLSS